MAELIDGATDQVHGDVGSKNDREDPSKLCEPCKVDNHIQPATGWCETCDEMLCNDCYKSHCRLKITRNHQLLSLEEIVNRKQMKKVASKCQKHGGKNLKYYCEDHAELGCSQCFVVRHRSCSEVVCISDVTTCESTEFNDLQRLLAQLAKRLEILEEKKECDTITSERQHSEAVECIKEAGEKMKALIDTLVKEQITKVRMTKEDNIRYIGEVDGIKKEVEEELNTARDMIAAVKRDNTQLFITMKHLQGEAKVMASKLGESEQSTIKMYEFVLHPELARLLETLTEFGTLKDTRDLNMDKATDELVDELEVGRFHHVYSYWYKYNGRSDAIQISTDRDIRLLYVLLYSCYSGDTNVELSITEGLDCLISCSSTHAYQGEDTVAVKVISDGNVHGLTLQAGHRYDIVVKITGYKSYYGYYGLPEVAEHGVKFSFSDSNISSYTDVNRGQIPGFRFTLL